MDQWAGSRARVARVPRSDGHADGDDDTVEFVRYCYRRRQVGWPELYDEMCAVAASGSFRGWGYPELADRGITFVLPELPRLAALGARVALEEAAT